MSTKTSTKAPSALAPSALNGWTALRYSVNTILTGCLIRSGQIRARAFLSLYRG